MLHLTNGPLLSEVVAICPSSHCGGLITMETQASVDSLLLLVGLTLTSSSLPILQETLAELALTETGIPTDNRKT